MENPRIIYAGTPEFAAPALQRLIQSDHQVIAVFTQPDRPAGRGREIQASPVKKLSISHQIPVFQPKTLNSEDIRDTISHLNPDIMIIAAYGIILPQTALDIPKYGCWNIHASLLPRWRGAAPIQRAIEAGDTQTGVSIMKMEAGLDTGPVFKMLETTIEVNETGGSLHDRLAVLGADALLDCLGAAARGELAEPRPQDNTLATYASKLSKAEAELDWYSPAIVLERQVRAFNPWPVAWFTHKEQRLRVFSAQADPAPVALEPGQVVRADHNGIVMATGEGTLRLLEIQAAGSRRMSSAQYLNAHPWP